MRRRAPKGAPVLVETLTNVRLSVEDIGRFFQAKEDWERAHDVRVSRAEFVRHLVRKALSD